MKQNVPACFLVSILGLSSSMINTLIDIQIKALLDVIITLAD
jgi:hypothetical protein